MDTFDQCESRVALQELERPNAYSYQASLLE